MQSDIKSIEEGIKKDAKASQDRFAKAVADNVFEELELFMAKLTVFPSKVFFPT